MTAVTYEFSAFPATYVPRYRNVRNKNHSEYRGYRFGCLSTFTFNTLTEARQEVRRLKRIYSLCDRDVVERHQKFKLLEITRVERTPVSSAA